MARMNPAVVVALDCITGLQTARILCGPRGPGDRDRCRPPPFLRAHPGGRAGRREPDDRRRPHRHARAARTVARRACLPGALLGRVGPDASRRRATGSRRGIGSSCRPTISSSGSSTRSPSPSWPRPAGWRSHRRASCATGRTPRRPRASSTIPWCSSRGSRPPTGRRRRRRRSSGSSPHPIFCRPMTVCRLDRCADRPDLGRRERYRPVHRQRVLRPGVGPTDHVHHPEDPAVAGRNRHGLPRSRGPQRRCPRRDRPDVPGRRLPGHRLPRDEASTLGPGNT